MKRTIFILIIIIVLCYFQYGHINKINNSYEILQAENPKKSIFENMLNEKLISVFTNINFPNNDLKKDSIKKNLYYYNIPLTIKSAHSILNESDKQTNLIVKQNNYRRLFYIYKGVKRFFIFNQTQKHNLYLNKNNVSSVNFFNQDIDNYPLIKNAKYIEIICRENTLIFIPYGFYFTYICDDNTITIDFNSESLFSNFLNIS